MIVLSDRINVREVILEMLMDVNRNNTCSHILLKNVLDKYNYLEEQDKAFIKRVFEGTLEREITIDHVINTYSKVPAEKMKPLIRSLIRMSVYQILYMDRVPDSAAINEAVKLAKKRKFSSLSGFVNGVLRTVSREKENCLKSDELSVRYSANELLVESLREDYGDEKAADILEHSLKERHLTVRIREELYKSDIDEILDEWEKEGIEFRCLLEPSYAYELKNTGDLERLDCFKRGLYTVMDASSMLVCENAHIKEGDIVLDVCAAPGGKCLHAVSKGAQVEARDVSEYKVSLIEENIKRLNAKNITVKVWDATDPDESIKDYADVVIADVPCSGFGVISKKPDIKNNISKDGLDSIVELQRKIIDNVCHYVKPGGVLMYSTCTLRKAENEDQVAYIVKNHHFEQEFVKTVFPDEDHDGFFIARLKRIG